MSLIIPLNFLSMLFIDITMTSFESILIIHFAGDKNLFYSYSLDVCRIVGI